MGGLCRARRDLLNQKEIFLEVFQSMALSSRLVHEEHNFLVERSVFPKFLKLWGEQWLYKEVTSFHVQISLVLILSSIWFFFFTFVGNSYIRVYISVGKFLFMYKTINFILILFCY